MNIPDSFKNEVKKTFKDRALQHKLEIPNSFDPQQRQVIEGYIQAIIQQVNRKYRFRFDDAGLQKLVEAIVSEMLGFGPIDSLIHDPDVTDVMVNAPDQVYVERKGKVQKTDVKFDDNEEIMFLIDKMIVDSGRRLDHASPFVDFKLKGLRVTAVIPPVAAASPVFTIRKMAKELLTFDDLKRLGTLNDKALHFIENCVKAQVTILVAGGTGAGKTTLTNLMIRQYVPDDERVIIIEDVEEMLIPQTNHCLKLLTRPSNLEGKGEIELRDLVRLSLHLRPDRLMIGEIRGEEAFYFLHAINTGHEGSICTIHASNPEEALNRLEMLALMDRPNIQPAVIRRFLELGVDMIIQMSRLSTGQRVISSITGFEYNQGVCVVKDIFRLEKKTVNGKEVSELKPTGAIPSFMNKLRAKTAINDSFFKPVSA